MSKGTYSGARTIDRAESEGGKKVGYCSNGSSAAYDFYAGEQAYYNLCMAMSYSSGGTMNVKVTDYETGNTEVDQDITVDKALCKGYGNEVAMEIAAALNKGLKNIKLTFNTSGSWFMDYENVRITKRADVAARTLKNIKLDFTGNNSFIRSQETLAAAGCAQWTAFATGIAIAADGTHSCVATDAANSVMTVNGKYHGTQYGVVPNSSFVVPVDGPAKFTYGTSAYSNDVTVTDADGNQIAKLNINGSNYSSSATGNVLVGYYGGGATTLTFTGGAYVPYFSIEPITASEVQYYVQYAKPNDVTGTLPDNGYVGNGSKVTLPINRLLWKEGYTLTGWSDGTTTYAPGAKVEVTKNTTFTAVFTQNTKSIDERPQAVTVKWDFQRKNGAPTMNVGGNTAGFYIAQATVDGETIDVKMDYNTKTGKIANANWIDWAQLNGGFEFYLPSSNGAVVSMETYSASTATTVDGVALTENTSKTPSKTVESDNNPITVVYGSDASYFRWIQIELPMKVSTPALASLTVGGADIMSSLADNSYTMDVTSYEDLPQVAATANAAGTVNVTQASAGNSYTATVVLKNKDTEAVVATYTVKYNKVSVMDGYTFLWAVNDGTSTTLSDDAEGYKSIKTSETNPLFAIKGKSNSVGGDSRFKVGEGASNMWALVIPSNAIVSKVEFLNCSENYYDNPNSGDNHTTTFTVASNGATVVTTDKDGAVLQYLAKGQTITSTLTGHQAGTPITFYADGGRQLAFGSIKIYYAIQDKGSLALTKQSVADGATVSHNGTVVFTFDNEVSLADGASIKVNGNDVRTVVSGSAVTGYFWGLNYNSANTVTLAANSVIDVFGNKYDQAINFTINVGARPTVTKKKYDVILGQDGNDNLQTVLNTYKAKTSTERVYIFIPDGSYELTGNSTISPAAGKKHIWNRETNEVTDEDYAADTYENAITQLKCTNLSIIGQSKNNTVLWNVPTIAGISYTSTLEFQSGASGNYIQDLTLKNMFAGGRNDKGVGVAFYDRGQKTILKNVSLWSNQDTYVSGGTRGYYEDCDIAGTVDFICGGGDYYFKNNTLIINDRGGNVILAPSTAASEKWGYVFEGCTVKAAEGATQVIGKKNFNIARPWQNSPAATLLNTTFQELPNDAGYAAMGNNMVLRFHEYGSRNSSGNLLDLSVRSLAACNPAASSDAPVLTAAQAAEYTMHNVVGGTDGWDPSEYTEQISVTGVALNGKTLSWDNSDYALCWIVLKNGAYYANVITNSIELTEAGTYTVRAANEMGGLGDASQAVTLLTIGTGGYSTYASEKPFTVTGATANTAKFDGDHTVTLTAIAEGTIIPAGAGIVLQGTAGETAAITNVATAGAALENNDLVGFTSRTALDQENNTYYVIGTIEGDTKFFGYTGAYMPANKAALVISKSQNAPARLAVRFANEETGISLIENGKLTIENSACFNLNGQRVNANAKGLVIINGKKFLNK